MAKIENIVYKNKLILAVFCAAAVWLLLLSGGSEAASITVAGGNDGAAVDSTCRLTEAITNINAGNATAYPECVGVGAFGANDTITLPAGTIMLTADLPQITKPVSLVGQGMGSTVIDGDSGQFEAIKWEYASSTDIFSLEKVTITGWKNAALYGADSSMYLNQVEVDGSGALPGGEFYGVFYTHDLPGVSQVTVKNVYIHSITRPNDGGYIHTLILHGSGGGTINADVSDVTISDILNQTGGLNGFFLGIGNYAYPLGSLHTINADIRNVTISNVESGQVGNLFVVVNFSSGGESTINASVANVTLKGLRGTSGAYGAPMGLGVAGLGMGSGDIARSSVIARNVLLADSRDSVSLNGVNCTAADYGPAFGGLGQAYSSLISGGGNISDDSSCAAYFTHASDLNDVSNLASTLGVLQDNGGLVPTIALLANSPAVDSGVVVAGLSEDARGAARPQGLAFDSGAYESSFSRQVSQGGDSAQGTGLDVRNSTSLAKTGAHVGVFAGVAATLVVFGVGGVVVARRRG